MNTNIVNHFQNKFSQHWPELPGYRTSWLDSVRLKAINHLTEIGFPAPRAEDWKYTNLNELLSISYLMERPVENSLSESQIESLLREVDAEASLVFVDGKLWKPHLVKNDSIAIMSLERMVAEKPNLIKEQLVSLPESSNAFESLNAAFMNDGAYVVVKKGSKITKPIQLLFVTSGHQKYLNVNTRNSIVFEEGSEATIVERYLTLDNKAEYLTNTVNRVVVKPDAVVNHIKIQSEAPTAYHLAVTRVYQEESSLYKGHSFSFGGKLSRNDIQIRMSGSGALSSLNGLMMVNGNRQSDFYTLLEHSVPNCTSEEFVKGILADSAKGVFRGKIKVDQDAQKTIAQLNNANLLLTDETDISSMPQLEIYADDVKCSHGSTSGRLDQEQLFYLVSRGVKESVANDLLVFAFANSILDNVNSESLRSHLKELVISALSADEQLRELIQ